MNTAGQPLLLCDQHDQPVLALDELIRHCDRTLAAGARLVTLFGHAVGDGAAVHVVAVLQEGSGAQGSMSVLQASAQAGAHFASLTPAHAAAHCFERELWEQTGLQPDGHPWLKPVRFEGSRQQHMDAYPFFSVRGQSVHEVGVGPIHAGVIEPGHFRFMCLGEQVQHLEIQLGYQHRGAEHLLLQRPPLQLTPLIESICGDSTIAYAWGHCAAIEALSGWHAPAGLDLLRGIALELERIAMHLATLTGLTTDIAYLQASATYARLRTAIINATQHICGNRFGRGWLRPGRTRGIDAAQRSALRATLDAFARDFRGVNSLLLHSRSAAARLRGVGIVDQLSAQQLGLLGPVARASGVKQDLRTDLPGPLHCAFPIASHTETGGDCWARLCVRIQEIQHALEWLSSVLDNDAIALQMAVCAADAQPARLRPTSLCVTQIEGPRGPVVQVLQTDAAGGLLHYKVQDPSLPNWFGLAMALRDNAISDFPVCNKSFDLSYCGNDL